MAYREAALIAATDYIDANYRFISASVTSTQALQFPRVPLFETRNGVTVAVVQGIPTALKKAVFILALEALAGPLQPKQAGRATIREKQKLEGVGETETEYSKNRQSLYPAVDAALATLTTGSSIGASTVIARMI